VAKQHNPDIRAQYERLIVLEQTKIQVIEAAMRKLEHICFGVMKNQQEFVSQTD